MPIRAHTRCLWWAVALLAVAASARADPPPTVAFLGIAAKPADAAAAAAAGLPDGVGLAVTFVDRAGPAAHGVRAGDLLQKLDDQLLVNAPQMVTLVRLHKPGDAVTLTVLRDGKATAVTVTLGEKPRPANPPPPPIGAAVGDDDRVPTLPGVVGPDPATGHLPDDFQLPGTTRTAIRYSDDTYSARVTADATGHKTMVVNTLDGKTVATGPVDTAEQWAAFPADVRRHLQAVQDLLNGKHPGTARGGHNGRPPAHEETPPP